MWSPLRARRLTDTGKESIITAPAAGTVLTRAVNPGDPIVPLTSYQPGTEMATIADMRDLIFKGTVDEIDVGKLSVGMLTRIKVGALPTDIVTGHVSRIAPQAQQKEGATLFDVEVELDPSNKITLRAGYSANADVIIREKKDVLVIPERLVTFEDGGKKATVEISGGDPKKPGKKVEIKTGISDGLNVEVVKGLKKGDALSSRPVVHIIGHIRDDKGKVDGWIEIGQPLNVAALGRIEPNAFKTDRRIMFPHILPGQTRTIHAARA